MTRYDRHSIALAVALSCLAGYVDAIGFLSSGHFFVSFMSGNSTRLGIALAQGRLGFGAIAGGVILLFVSGVVVGSLQGDRMGSRRKEGVLILVAAFLAIAALAFSTGYPAVGTAFMLLAMGAENAVFDRNGDVGIGLTYMTGTLVKMGKSIAAIATGGSPTTWTLYARLWAGMVAGAAIGALINDRLGASALWFASGAAFCMALTMRRNRFATEGRAPAGENEGT